MNMNKIITIQGALLLASYIVVALVLALSFVGFVHADYRYGSNNSNGSYQPLGSYGFNSYQAEANRIQQQILDNQQRQYQLNQRQYQDQQRQQSQQELNQLIGGRLYNPF